MIRNKCNGGNALRWEDRANSDNAAISTGTGTGTGTDSDTGTGTATATGTKTESETELPSSYLGQRSRPLIATIPVDSSALRSVPARRRNIPANTLRLHSSHGLALS